MAVYADRSNGGNTARKFFKNPHISSNITVINTHLIERFLNILMDLSNSHEINCDAFDKYATDTAKLYDFYQ